MMKKIIYILAISGMMFACTIDEAVNPNAPAVDGIIANASETDLNNLATGVLASMRNGHAIYVTASGTITRELYLFDADPRNTTDLIGTKGSLDNDTFYSTSNWSNRYRTIKNCNLILDALENAKDEVSTAEKSGYSGFAKTMMAHQFLILYSAYYDSGIRLDVADPNVYGSLETNPGTVLTFIRALLDEADTELSEAEFAIIFTEGFEGFDTPATFAKFNRSLAARAALYDADMSEALTHLGNSFFDITGDLDIGPKMIFSTSGGDILNDLYKPPGQNGNQIVVSDTWIDEAQAGDSRVTAKSALRDKTSITVKSGISGDYETRLYSASTSSIDIIRNEELMLIYAEANIGTDNVEALAGINAVRSSANLIDLAGTVTEEDVLVERRYSLWAEGHRMIDLRRTGNLNDTYITLDVIKILEDGVLVDVQQIIFDSFPLPLTEIGN